MHNIDTRLGTANHQSFSNGNCLPITGVPFGMNYFAPQTSNERGTWWFHPDDHVFQGYRLTHQPSPWIGDFCYLLLTPVSGNPTTESLFDYQGSYSQDKSIFSPSKLSIFQNRYRIQSTLAPSTYGGILDIQYQMPDPGLVLSLPGNYTMELIDDFTLSGTINSFDGSSRSEDPNLKMFFTLRFETKLLTTNFKEQGSKKNILLNFEDTNRQTVKMGFSFINPEQATLNLERETKQSLDDYINSSETLWDGYFNRVKVTNSDKKLLSTFYHNLYRCFLYPQRFYEIDENENKIHYDTTSKTIKGGPLYTNTGFWDTYKSIFPLFSIIAQKEYKDMLDGFLNSYRESGYLPRWLSPDERGSMPGTLIDAVIADASVKSIGTELMPEFLEAMNKSATIQIDNERYGRQGVNEYLEYGYIPNSFHESVNHTLDYAYSDFCISQVAKTLGDNETSTKYSNQSLNYKNLFDKETGFMRSKNENGDFREDFLPTRWGRDYAEGSAWQSSFAVFHDFSGLISEYGSSNKFLQKIIELCNQDPIFNVDGYGFEIHEMSEMAATEFGQVAISNQPSFHLPYLFSYVGKPEYSQPLLKQLINQCFNDGFTAYPGDEDNGSMSAWFVFNCLGFYPVTPGSGEYVIAMPQLDEVKLCLENGKTITITTHPNMPQQQFISDIKLNDKSYTKLYLNHSDLMEGPSIDYHLGIVPNGNMYNSNDLPYSLSVTR